VGSQPALPFRFKEDAMSKWHWSVWVKGLFAALISGAATGVSSNLIIPTEVQATHPTLVWKLAGFGGFLGVANYLKSSPLPVEDGGETGGGA
jgi:hypothetical protein